ncbi:MAG: acetyl-CoA carboxylase carboxyltransferase subunit alpha [Aquificaceae bacterium]|nr:acetyl-CoA carboxylase carboxyltransferase subunit alpha [Aquificaceae bacterium]MDW8237292.1 acetyl-CoA carboxylase carboxyltransferase subunit alpha [Aquificaceae bacterium]
MTSGFEKELTELHERIEHLSRLYSFGEKSHEPELRKLQREFKKKSSELYKRLDPWDKVQTARHPQRPRAKDYIDYITSRFLELHGDRVFGDDKAIIAGIGFMDSLPIAIIAQEKGKTTKEKLERNFGMPHPEGYRKAIRVARLAERWSLPLITFVDTPGAYPGIGAEERGQAQAIAECIITIANIKVPSISVIIGEGGSGGALALAVTDRVLMFENAVYSVISPEGCAAILWKDQNKVREASRALKLTSKDLKKLGVIDCIVPEPWGASHLNARASARILKYFLRKTLRELLEVNREELLFKRREKFTKMGVFLG